MKSTKIPRTRPAAEIRQALMRSSIVALLGVRQCGKTTLARQVAQGSVVRFFDLESSGDRQVLASAAEQVLGTLEGLVVLDEIQTMPELFPALRVLADRQARSTRFLLLGSASPDLVRGASETLAGRVAFVHLGGFDLMEVGADRADELWFRGRLPRSFLAHGDTASYAWRQDFIETFLSRDARRFGLTLPPEGLRRFWTMLAHLHGDMLNVSDLGRAMSLDAKTAARYVDTLAGAYLVRRLPPWFENAGKRIVKAPKIYLRDTGLLHALLGLRTPSEVLSHPRFGLSWEGFAMEHVIGWMKAERDAYFWATHAGAELDLLIARGGARYGFEFKYADAPKITKSMRIAMTDLGLKRLFIVHPGGDRFDMEDGITSLSLADLFKVATRL